MPPTKKDFAETLTLMLTKMKQPGERYVTYYHEKLAMIKRCRIIEGHPLFRALLTESPITTLKFPRSLRITKSSPLCSTSSRVWIIQLRDNPSKRSTKWTSIPWIVVIYWWKTAWNVMLVRNRVVTVWINSKGIIVNLRTFHPKVMEKPREIYVSIVGKRVIVLGNVERAKRHLWSPLHRNFRYENENLDTIRKIISVIPSELI